jgi:hypothetical protein
MTEDIKFTEDLKIDVSEKSYISSCIKFIYKESSSHYAVMKLNVYMSSEVYLCVGINTGGLIVLIYTETMKSGSKRFENVSIKEI